MKKKVAVVTATRAEYGILRPLLEGLRKESEIEMQLLVTGTHLLKKYGNTQNEIIKDQIHIFRKIPILEQGNTPYDISITMANAIRLFAEYFREENPDLLIVLGDRTEILGICAAAMNQQVPIAHLHGGELTEGAVDDCVRHAVTKMAYLHFPSTEVYRQRIIQMGEDPLRVFNVGALGVENILHAPLLSKKEMCAVTGVPLNRKYVVVTFHPVTLEIGMEREQVNELIQAMNENKGYFYLVTKANADTGGDLVNEMFENIVRISNNIKLVASLGMIKYLSALKYCEFVLGNSSSGVIEAPALGVPTVNIGDRQKGRLMADSIVQCKPEKESILQAMQFAAEKQRSISRIYGDGNTSYRIIQIVREYLESNRINLKKKFYDVEREK